MSLCLYVYAAQSPRAELVAVVKKYSIDLLASPPGGRPGNDDAINDLDQVPAGSPVPAKLRVVGHVYQRDPAVRDFVLKRAAGTCEHCGQAGFLMENGSRFLEAHHIISLAQQGPDTVNNVVALCANHHREAHYGADKEKLEKAMLAALRRLNRKP